MEPFLPESVGKLLAKKEMLDSNSFMKMQIMF
jgi:hypothetical protein